MLNIKARKTLEHLVRQGESVEKVYEIEIAGVPLKLRTSHDEKTLKELVGLVDNKIKEALSRSKHGSYQNAAVLAALDIAEELYNLKIKARIEIDQIEHRARKVLAELESSQGMQTGLIN